MRSGPLFHPFLTSELRSGFSVLAARGMQAPDRQVLSVRRQAGRWSPATTERNRTMAAIGYVTKLEDGRYQGTLKTLTIRAEVTFTPNPDKSNGNQPDYRIFSDGIDYAENGIMRSPVV